MPQAPRQVDLGCRGQCRLLDTLPMPDPSPLQSRILAVLRRTPANVAAEGPGACAPTVREGCEKVGSGGRGAKGGGVIYSRYAVVIGRVYGALRVVGWSTETYRYYGRTQRNHLLAMARKHSTGCNSCTPRIGFAACEPAVSRHCSVCYDLPHRRPRFGLYKCGKAFREETFGPAEYYVGHSNLADCQEGRV